MLFFLMQASSSEPSLVTVKRASSGNDAEDGSAAYRLDIAGTVTELTSVRNVTVDFVSNLTGQRQVVLLTYAHPREFRGTVCFCRTACFGGWHQSP